MMDRISRYKRVEVTIRYDDSSLDESPGSIPTYDDLSFEGFPELCQKFDSSFLDTLLLLVKEDDKRLGVSGRRDHGFEVAFNNEHVVFVISWSQVRSALGFDEAGVSRLNLQTQVLVQVCEFLAGKVGLQNVSLIFRIEGG